MLYRRRVFEGLYVLLTRYLPNLSFENLFKKQPSYLDFVQCDEHQKRIFLQQVS